MGFMDKTGPLQPVLEPILRTVLGVVVDMKVDFEVEMFWNRVNGQRVIQAHAPPQPPVIEHPDTKLPTWFCNIHSHSAALRDERDGVLPETTGASKLNKSDVFYGDGSPISAEVLKHVDEITKKNQEYIAMKEGDVVLVDNYRTMHGRNIFEVYLPVCEWRCRGIPSHPPTPPPTHPGGWVGGWVVVVEGWVDGKKRVSALYADVAYWRVFEL